MVKHLVFGDCQTMFAMTDHLTDAVFRECGHDYRMGAQLRRMTINADGTVSTEELLDCPEGVIRDPCVSYDGSTVAFSIEIGPPAPKNPIVPPESATETSVIRWWNFSLMC